MLQILTVIAPIFILIFASALLRRLGVIGDNWSGVLNEYALKLGFPVLIFNALYQTPISFAAEAGLIAANSIFLLASLLLGWATGRIFRLGPKMTWTLFICFAFGNMAYLGIPVLAQVFGEKILPTASLIAAVYLFWMFTVVTGVLDHVNRVKTGTGGEAANILRGLGSNPLLVAVILGLLAGSLHFQLPGPVAKALDMVTASVTPIVLIVIGLFIGKSRLGKLSEWAPVAAYSGLKLAILPAGFYFAARFLELSPPQFSSSLIDAAMPLGITPFALADRYGLDKNFIARAIVLSTTLSALSLPLWISIG